MLFSMKDLNILKKFALFLSERRWLIFLDVKTDLLKNCSFLSRAVLEVSILISKTSIRWQKMAFPIQVIIFTYGVKMFILFVRQWI